MNGGYSHERLLLYDALVKKKLDISSGRPWMLEPRALRFRHGDTIAELKVPFHMGGEDEACIEKAVLGLLTLIIKRNEYTGPERRNESSGPIHPLPDFTPAIKEKSYRTDIFITDSIEKGVAADILSYTPNIDTAMLAVWLGAEGHGRKFIKWTSTIFEKALKEEAKSGGEEKTSYLAMLAVLSVIRKKKERIKEFRIKGLPYEKADHAISVSLFAAFRRSLLALLHRLKEEDAQYRTEAADALLSSAVTPKAFLAIPSNILSSALNPYGITEEVFETISPFAKNTGENIVPSADLISATYSRLKDNGDALTALSQLHATARFRSETLRYLSDMDMPGITAHERLHEIYNDDRLVKGITADPKAAEELSAAFDDVKSLFSRDLRRAETVSAFQRFLASFKKSLLGGIWKSGKSEAQEAAKEIIASCHALRFDDHVEAAVGRMRAYTSDRRIEYTQNVLLEEYNRGRLYRFSVDDRPVLKTLTTGEEGQLFIDMKDFTRRTLKVKEIAMVDFMKDWFYAPILAAAAKYGVGSGLVTDETGIRLTNIPGDAAIFSGGVVSLVSLARDIQRITKSYRDTLLHKLPPLKKEEIIDEVHKNFEAKRAGLKEKRAALNKAQEMKTPGIEVKLIALGAEEHRLESVYRDELESAVKHELEAGLYISYGKKAEIAILEPRAEFSAPVKVSVGEKINEASRGTGRNPMVRARFEMLLENERVKRGQMSLHLPLDVYVGRIYSIKMPPELDVAFEKLVINKKAAGAEALSTVMSNEFLGDLRKVAAGEPLEALRVITAATDIYNKGQAVSEPALFAYMNETKGTKRFFKKTVTRQELNPYIQESFFFPALPMELIFGYEIVKGAEVVEIFHRTGEMTFKGFEAGEPTVIYEMLNQDKEFYRTLLKHHFHEWAKEAGEK
ncbi:MAG: hypothetical protein HY884_00560 [Deltaproteobacteria bacterium]|nr:hypothetical protein [Deltaproteobacteria bacterium]